MSISRMIMAACAAGAFALSGAHPAAAAPEESAAEADGSIAVAQRFGDLYQQTSTVTCDPAGAPCTVPFSVLDRGHLKVLKASCSIKTSEGGSPSKEITGASLGRLTANQKVFVPGQFLSPIQTEFAEPGQIVLNFLVDTLWVVPRSYRPAIQIARLNGPKVTAVCTVVGQELVSK